MSHIHNPDQAITCREDIIELINKRYNEDIRLGLWSRSAWRVAADISETVGYIFLGITSIISFSSGFFDIRVLSYVAGSVGILSGLLLKFAIYAMAQSKERTSMVNKILADININPIVDISDTIILPPDFSEANTIDVSPDLSININKVVKKEKINSDVKIKKNPFVSVNSDVEIKEKDLPDPSLVINSDAIGKKEILSKETIVI